MFISCIATKTRILHVCAVCTVYCAVCTVLCVLCTVPRVERCMNFHASTVLCVLCYLYCVAVYVHGAVCTTGKPTTRYDADESETEKTRRPLYPVPLLKKISFLPFFQMGGWRKRSLIDDAKFETLANREFEKREKNLSNTDISEQDDVFTQNGVHPSATKDDVVITSYVMKLKEGLGSISRILKLFEVG